jgi:5-methylcytosine-specific restriction endonuclease McrA
MAKRSTSDLFPKLVRYVAFWRCSGNCQNCSKELYPGSYQYDHIIPVSIGGKSDLANCQVLCRQCHNDKTANLDTPRAAKTKRQKAKHEGAFRASRHPVPGSRSTQWKKPLRGPAIRREPQP